MVSQSIRTCFMNASAVSPTAWKWAERTVTSVSSDTFRTATLASSSSSSGGPAGGGSPNAAGMRSMPRARPPNAAAAVRRNQVRRFRSGPRRPAALTSRLMPAPSLTRLLESETPSSPPRLFTLLPCFYDVESRSEVDTRNRKVGRLAMKYQCELVVDSRSFAESQWSVRLKWTQGAAPFLPGPFSPRSLRKLQ